MFNRILVAVDGSESGDVAVSFTTALARDSWAAVRVVHVNELLVGGRGFTEETDREAKAILQQAVAALTAAGIAADGVGCVANCFTVDARIAGAAHEWGADVIVFGSRRRRWMRRFPGTGMRERVTRLTGLPTLTAPAPLKVEGRYRGGPAELERRPSPDRTQVTP